MHRIVFKLCNIPIILNEFGNYATKQFKKRILNFSSQLSQKA